MKSTLLSSAALSSKDQTLNKAFFLDRDGTINVDYDFVHKPSEWTFCEGAVDAIKTLNNLGFKVVVVTNQSGVSRGHYSLEDVNKLHAWVDKELDKHQARIDSWYIAAHHPEYDKDHKHSSEDRKPGTGMFLKAADQFEIDFSKSHMAGDKITDLMPAVELGMTPYFVRSRFEASQNKDWLNEHNISTYDSLFEIVKAHF